MNQKLFSFNFLLLQIPTLFFTIYESQKTMQKLWKNTKYDSFATKMNFLSHI
eukprot:12147.XXX_434740_434895_1 [CDS] Oithona nana genome sequencing.